MDCCLSLEDAWIIIYASTSSITCVGRPLLWSYLVNKTWMLFSAHISHGKCNFQQRTLYQILKLSLKFKKCAISNQIIQNSRPSRSPKKARKKDKKDATKNPGTPEKPLRSQKTVSETPEELLTARKTRFCAISPKKCLRRKENIFEGCPKTLKTRYKPWMWQILVCFDVFDVV